MPHDIVVCMDAVQYSEIGVWSVMSWLPLHSDLTYSACCVFDDLLNYLCFSSSYENFSIWSIWDVCSLLCCFQSLPYYLLYLGRMKLVEMRLQFGSLLKKRLRNRHVKVNFAGLGVYISYKSFCLGLIQISIGWAVHTQNFAYHLVYFLKYAVSWNTFKI